MKYKIEIYGWSMESMGFTLTDKQLEEIETIIKDNSVDELWEVRFDLDDVLDVWEPDLFHINNPFDNGTMYCTVMDEKNNKVIEFNNDDMGDVYENVEDLDNLYPYEGYIVHTTSLDGDVKNTMLIMDENKGGIYEMCFESDEVPKPSDFSIMGGSIDTPDGEIDFVSRVFFKNKVLEVYDMLDCTGKSSTMEIYTKEGRIIN